MSANASRKDATPVGRFLTEWSQQKKLHTHGAIARVRKASAWAQWLQGGSAMRVIPLPLSSPFVMSSTVVRCTAITPLSPA